MYDEEQEVIQSRFQPNVLNSTWQMASRSRGLVTHISGGLRAQAAWRHASCHRPLTSWLAASSWRPAVIPRLLWVCLPGLRNARTLKRKQFAVLGFQYLAPLQWCVRINSITGLLVVAQITKVHHYQIGKMNLPVLCTVRFVERRNFCIMIRINVFSTGRFCATLTTCRL